MPEYTATIQLTDDVVQLLGKSKYNLALAKEVVDGFGTVTANTIFTTRKVVPNTSITWSAEYALNWTSTIPAKGAQALTLGDGGLWENNNEDAKKGYLTVKNAFDNVNILVGQQDPQQGDGWKVIYFSPAQLLKEGLGRYQPRETINIWYGFQQTTGFVIAKQQTQVARYDMSKAKLNNYQHWFQYTEDGIWLEQNKEFPSDGKMFLPPPNGRFITFTIKLATDAELQWKHAFSVKMNQRSWSVEVANTTSEFSCFVRAENRFEDESASGIEGQGIDLNGDINASLAENVKDGYLPEGETWTIEEHKPSDMDSE